MSVIAHALGFAQNPGTIGTLVALVSLAIAGIYILTVAE